MRSINAISLTHNVNDWLEKSRRPRILHIFDYVCNLIDERGEILSIVTPEIGVGPFNLVIEGEICFSEHLNLQSLISRSPGQLNLSNLTINTADAKLWNSCPDWEALYVRKDDILTQLMSLSIPNNRASIPNSLVSNLSPALIKAEISTASAAASRVAGLGPGLTPSGDDFLIGALYATRIVHPPEIAGTLAKEIADIAAPLTTSLSAAWLRSAGRGEAGILWHEFFEALVSHDAAVIQVQIEKLLSIGHTSGADALAGFNDTFVSYAESEARLCHS